MPFATLALLFATTTGAAPSPAPAPDDIGRKAAECAAFYRSFHDHVARTDEEKKNVTYMQGFMIVLAKEHGISEDEFVAIWVPYKKELERRADAGDKAFIRAEMERCGAFAASAARDRANAKGKQE